MVFSEKIINAVRLSIRTHELHQKQKRKGKDVPYIVHPLIVGMILARAGADEDTIAAGILHDTIEDSPANNKVTREILEKRFNTKIADTVQSVSEKSKELSWEERKKEAVSRIAGYSKESLLVKSADLTSNISELLADFAKVGDKMFLRFGGPKNKVIAHYIEAVDEVLKRRFANPLSNDLRRLQEGLKIIQ